MNTPRCFAQRRRLTHSAGRATMLYPFSYPLRLRWPSLRATAAGGNALSDWIHIEAIRALVHHTSAVLVAVLLFGFTGLIVRRLLHEGPIKRLIVVIDEVVLLLLLVFFAYDLFTTLYK
jgi:hypothetical protein